LADPDIVDHLKGELRLFDCLVQDSDADASSEKVAAK
jgi:hypothetical protein